MYLSMVICFIFTQPPARGPMSLLSEGSEPRTVTWDPESSMEAGDESKHADVAIRHKLTRSQSDQIQDR